MTTIIRNPCSQACSYLRETLYVLVALQLSSSIALPADMPFVEVNPETATAFRLRDTQRPFVAVGVNYFDHETGWAPKLWKQFDESRVRQHLTLIRDQGFNTIRMFLTVDSFHSKPGQLDPEGEAKFRRLLALCHELKLYVIPSGPDHWEGLPDWRKGRDLFADETILRADETWWRLFAERFKDEPAILAYDLYNEPVIRWDTPAMKAKWNEWLAGQYGSVDKIAAAWEMPVTQVGTAGEIAVPPEQPALNDQRLYDYQLFRESIGDEWTRRLSAAIRSVDPHHLITVGHIQWAVPIYIPAVQIYAGFDLHANLRHVDFTTVHFYPIAPPQPNQSPEGMAVNALYLETLLYLCPRDKPLMLGEFGWYGGGDLRVGEKVILTTQPVEHQLAWGEELLAVSRGRLAGWLNWAFADTAASRDLSRWSGCWTEDLQLKPWGEALGRFARRITEQPEPFREYPADLRAFTFDRRAMVTAPETGHHYRNKLLGDR